MIHTSWLTALKPDCTFNFDSGRLLKSRLDSDTGYLHFYGRLARAGQLSYFSADGRERVEHVSPDVLFDRAHRDSVKTSAITRLHPSENRVNSSNIGKYGKGLSTNQVFVDGDFLGFTGTVTHKDMVDAVLSGELTQLSAGYDAWKVQRDDKNWVQMQRRNNHIAGVPAGRAPGARFVLEGLNVDAADSVGADLGEVSKAMGCELWFAQDQDDDYWSDRVLVQVPGFSWQADESENQPETEMKYTFNVDGVSYPSEDHAAAQAVSGLASRAATLQANNDALTTERDALVAKVTALETEKSTLQSNHDSLEGERDGLKVKLTDAEKAQFNADELNVRVADAIALWSEALPILQKDAADYAPDYSLSASDVRKAVVAKLSPTVNLDGKSDDYVLALYENLPKDKVSQGSNTDAARLAIRSARQSTNADAKDKEEGKEDYQEEDMKRRKGRPLPGTPVK